MALETGLIISRSGKPRRVIVNRKGGHARLVGLRSGRLVVVAVYRAEGASLAVCLCDCGQHHTCAAGSIVARETRSCGCLRRETSHRIAQEHSGSRNGSYRHGRYREAEYETWRGMIRRCYRENCDGFKNYGGRGIQVCDRWRFGEGGISGLECFIADMGARPSSGHSIHRKENDGHYEPGNCTWATRSEQAKVQRPGYRFGDPLRTQVEGSPSIEARRAHAVRRLARAA